MSYNGRTVIYSDETMVTDENIIDILQKAYNVHTGNQAEIEYLWNYRKGVQPILAKKPVSETRANNIVIENRAAEIVDFKTAYLLGEPIQYVARNNSKISKALNQLNDFVFAEDKASKDKELAEWFYVCGTAYRLVLPDPTGESDESPFEIYTLDPRNTFVVYTNTIEHKPLLGVTFVKKEDNSLVFTCYSKDTCYYISYKTNNVTRKNEFQTLADRTVANPIGDVPIVEYPANTIRMGAFETVLNLLDAINQVASDRVDAIQNFVESIMVFKGVDADDDIMEEIRTFGGVRVPSDGDISYLVQELSQDSTQTLSDNMYQTVLKIVGMPSSGSGESSDSSNNGAVILKNGWQGAEARAKDTEMMFKKSEKIFLKLALKIANINSKTKFKLQLKDIDIRFTRRNYENLLVKSQVLTTMLANEKIHPRLAFESSGLFIDTELAYTMSEEYAKENADKENQNLNNFRTTVKIDDVDSKQNAMPTNEG